MTDDKKRGGGFGKPTNGARGTGSGKSVGGAKTGGARGFGKPAYGKPTNGGKFAHHDRPANGDKPAFGKPAGDRPAYGKSAGGDRPAYGKPAGDRPAYGKPSGDRPARPDGERSFGKPSFSKPAFSKPAGDRPAYGKPAGDRPARPDGERSFGKPSFSKPAYGKPAGERPVYGKPAGERPARPDGERSFGKPSFSKPAYGKPAGERPAYGKPAGDRPAYGKPAGERPARPDGERSFGKPSFSKPAFSRPAGDRPAYGKPAGDRPARPDGERSFGKPSFSKPAYGKPAGDRPAYGKPAGDRPARPDGERSFGKPSFSKPAYGKPAGDRPAYGKPAGDRPARPDGERSFGKPSFSKPAFSRPAGDRPAYGKPAGDRPAYGKPAGDRPARPDGERSFGKPSFSKPAFSRPAGDRPAFSRPAGDRPTYGKPAGDRPSRPAYGDRPARAEGARGYAKPEAGKSDFSRPSSGKPGFSKPAYVGGHMRTVSRSTYAQEPVESTGLSINARRVALDVLCDVHQNGAYASLTLDDQLRAAKLSPEDRRLVTSIVYGTLENETRIDYALDKLMEHPTQVPVQRDILRMSAYQILFLDRVPDSAAVNEAVKIVKSMDMESASGFINAVLRNLVRGKEEMEWPKREDDLREYLHIMGSMPMWIVDKLIAAYGEEEAERIVMFRDTEHPLVLRPNLARLTDAEFEALLEKKAWRCERALAPHAYFVYGASEITFDRDYIDGLFSIQGQSSMLAAEAVGAKVGMKILDACAAPGGKSAYLCESMQMTGRVYAWELHEKRTLLLEGVKRRLHLDNLRISVRDATEPRDDLDEMLDAVLLDAPCSGLGVMVQKPDIKLRLKEADIEPIVKQQQKMLETLCRYVKRGGLLVYSTCSILPEENTEQIRAFLEAHPDYQLEALPTSYPEVLRAHQQPLGLQLLNYRDGVEGFFIARMRRDR